MRTVQIATVLILGIFLLSACGHKQNQQISALQHEKAIAAEVEKLAPNWPENSQRAARLMVKKYGDPTLSTPDHLVWKKIPSFKKITVFKEGGTHNFPILHSDVIEHVVNYPIPADKADDLLKFNGSIIFNRTLGELSARSHTENMNILALNLATEIIDDKKDWENARREYEKLSMELMKGKITSKSENLQFTSQDHTADADRRSNIDWAQAQEVTTKSRPLGRKGALRQAQKEMAE